MTRSELIEKLSEKNPHLKPRDVEDIVELIFEEITKSLIARERVEFRGFGAFSVRFRKSRHGRNPRNGQPVEVPEKYVPFFKTGKELRDLLNP